MMANNRMLLICNVCHPEVPATFTYGQDDGYLHLAKWYPAGGFIADDNGAYYRNDDGDNMGKQFLEFLDKHQHKEVSSEHYSKGAGQPNPVRIEYESEDMPDMSNKHLSLKEL